MIRRCLAKLTILPLVAVLLVVGFPAPAAYADELDFRSIEISRSTINSAAEYDMSFFYTTPATIGSVVFEFCDNSPLFHIPCNTPPGIDTTGGSLSSQLGETGFSGDFSVNGRVLLSRTPSLTGGSLATYGLDSMVNPSNLGTVFVRVSTHTSTDGTGVHVDRGGTAFSLNNDINVTAFVPPFMDFCVAESISGVDCSTSSGSFLDLGILGSGSTASDEAHFVISSNSVTGYTISVIGNTLTSGNKIIPALITPTPSIIGTSQFGINMRDNSSPNVGNNVVGIGTGVPETDYNTPNLFKYQNGDTIAGSTLSSDYNNFTMSFITNVHQDQGPGVYSTTLTLMAMSVF